MPFMSQYNSQKKVSKRINTSPTKSEIESAKKLGIDLGKNWRAYSKEVRVHIYIKNMEEMVRAFFPYL